MQPLVTTAQWTLLAKGQQPKVKLEIEIAAGVWINICSLWDPAAGKLKNYLKDISFSSGGARTTVDPIAGEFSAVINNKGNIFHPNHPDSGRQGYFRAGRKVRISLGGNYPPSGPWAGGDEYWQRIIGYMDEPEFSSDTFELTIKGLDYMKVLSDMKFTKESSAFPATPIDNFWGTLLTTDSLATTTWGPEQYNGADAADPVPGDEVNGIGAWVVFAGAPGTLVSSQVQIGGFSNWELEFIAAPPPPVPPPDFSIADLRYANAFNAAAGQEYYVTFKYTRTAGVQGDGKLNVGMIGGGVSQGASGALDPLTNNVWHTGSFSFTYGAGGLITISIYSGVQAVPATWRIDNISILAVLGNNLTYYNMPALCTGIYHVELDGEPAWPGKQKGEGWYYDLATNRFWFDEDKIVAAGVNNLDIYYFTAQTAGNVVADILAKAGLYATRAAACDPAGAQTPPGMQIPLDTGVSIDKVWFEPGSTYIAAVKKLCERSEPAGWRFHFNWEGSPRFVAAPIPGVAVFVPFLPQHIKSPRIRQNRNEIRNRIVIAGNKIAELVGWEENMRSHWEDARSDLASIANYGEHTLNITNHLFQDQASVTNMCINLLALLKDPNWYLDFEMTYNAVPLVLGDTIEVHELLDINLPIGIRFAIHTCLIRNAQVSLHSVNYKCQI